MADKNFLTDIIDADLAEGKIRTTMMLGLVFLETAIIYALLVVILIIFVL